MSDKDKLILNKIIERISNLLKYCDGHDYERFEGNRMLTEACVFNLLQIGELSKYALSDEFKDSYSYIPWKQINGMRNRIVHGYEGVTLKIVWDTINDDLPELSDKLKEIEKIL